MSLFDELFADTLGDSRPKSPEVAQKSPAENGSITRVIARSPRSPANGEKSFGDAPCPACNCASLWRGESGTWHCEQCTPPGTARVATFRTFAGRKAPPMPAHAADWPADLDAKLKRVAVGFEWTRQDVADFVQWARRAPAGLADARAFLEAEAARLPVPGLTDHRRVVQAMLAADSALRVAWTCADDGADPVRLVLAIRGAGCCELAIPRERFDALALPQLIARLTDSTRPDGL